MSEEDRQNIQDTIAIDDKKYINEKDYSLIDLPFSSKINYSNYNHDKNKIKLDIRKRLDKIYKEMLESVDKQISEDNKIAIKLDINFSLYIDTYY